MDLASAASLLKSNAVVDRDSDILLTSQVSLGGLDGRVSQEELDLLKIPAGFAAEFGAGAAKVVSAKALYSDLFCRLLDRMTTGNFQLLKRLLAQIERVLDANNIDTITAEAVLLAR